MLARLHVGLRGRPLRSLSHLRTSTPHRLSSTSSQQTPQPHRPEDSSDFLDYGFARHTSTAFSTFSKLFRYTLLGGLFLSGTAFTAYEGTHLYVESVGLSPETDAEARKWEWDRETDKWSGGATGGTDSALGFAGAHAVRAAWAALHWGTGADAGAVMSSGAFSGKGRNAHGGLNVVDAKLEYTQDLVTIALKRALEPDRVQKLHPATVPLLMYRHAGILELMGTRDALFESREELERVWRTYDEVEEIDRARLALKLGDLNARLGDSSDAVSWWSRALSLAQGSRADAGTAPSTPVVPESAPLSPFAQRTIASVLVSLSVFHSTTGQLKQAEGLQKASIELLKSTRRPVNVQTASPAEALHSLLLLHRMSLLQVHLAEVQYALREPLAQSVNNLQQAADSSERVALLLAGLPLVHPDAPNSRIPHPPSSEHPPASGFSSGPKSLRRPAAALLRDSKRSAAEAWSLLGVLTEEAGGEGAKQKALGCYERALGWAGVQADRAGGIGVPGEGVLEVEWRVLWGNYVRVREGLKENK